jgi:hypothetical protein
VGDFYLTEYCFINSKPVLHQNGSCWLASAFRRKLWYLEFQSTNWVKTLSISGQTVIHFGLTYRYVCEWMCGPLSKTSFGWVHRERLYRTRNLEPRIDEYNWNNVPVHQTDRQTGRQIIWGPRGVELGSTPKSVLPGWLADRPHSSHQWRSCLSFVSLADRRCPPWLRFGIGTSLLEEGSLQRNLFPDLVVLTF